jgi:hypothetical protein
MSGRDLLIGLVMACVVAGVVIWSQQDDTPSLTVQVGDCLDSGSRQIDCRSLDARYKVIGEGRGTDPAGPCRAYPGATAITFDTAPDRGGIERLAWTIDSVKLACDSSAWR